MSAAPHTIDDIIELFDLLGEDWEGRFRHLIDLGKTLPPFPDSERVELNLVRGCTAKVWMIDETRDGIFSFQADSDSHLVRGLIAILMRLYDNRPIAELETVDIDTVFRRLGLEQNLSPNRRNGFFSMVARIKTRIPGKSG